MTSDVVIIGGGLMGLSTAYHLFADGFHGRIIVIERGDDLGKRLRLLRRRFSLQSGF